MVENRNFFLRHMYLAPQLEVIPFDFYQDPWRLKNESPTGYHACTGFDCVEPFRYNTGM